jgi:hypothetical protein
MPRSGQDYLCVRRYYYVETLTIEPRAAQGGAQEGNTYEKANHEHSCDDVFVNDLVVDGNGADNPKEASG